MSKLEHIYIRGFWDRVEAIIKDRGISKAELARRCRFGINVLKRHNSIYLPYLARICAELHVSADYLLFGNEE